MKGSESLQFDIIVLFRTFLILNAIGHDPAPRGDIDQASVMLKKDIVRSIIEQYIE
jgi:hypothetical protein